MLNLFHYSTKGAKKKKKKLYKSVEIFVSGMCVMTDSTKSSDWGQKNVTCETLLKLSWYKYAFS